MTGLHWNLKASNPQLSWPFAEHLPCTEVFEKQLLFGRLEKEQENVRAREVYQTEMKGTETSVPISRKRSIYLSI